MRRYSYKPRSLRKKEKKTTVKLITNFVIAVVFVYFLLTWGLPFLIGGLSYFHKFKSSPQKTASTTKQGEAITPPVLNIPYEATNSASIKISGYSSPNSKVEIYLDDDLKTTVNTQSDGSFQTDYIELALGTNNIAGRTVDDKDNKSLPSKNIKVIYSNEKPKLQVTEPPDNQEVKGGDKKIKVSGKTDTDNSVNINGQTVIVNSDGNFSTTISLNDGDNNIAVVATNQVGNTNTVNLKVKYSPSP